MLQRSVGTVIRRLGVRRLGLAAWVAMASAIGSLPASPAPSSFLPFIGSWTGTGQVRLEDGRSEQIKCRAYYTDRPSGMGIALKCASGGSKIDLRAQLQSDGARIQGNWEERQYNAAGSIAGVAAGNKLSMTLDGGGLNAAVVVTTSGAAQTFSISTDAGMVRGAQIGLARDPNP